ncbi:RNA 3'-terminal phosphate cyclase [Shewanella algae]|uniref:RNA 3'-terminal phosphate cyclase n=1 Tax=Shewanella algae TaxID=38313 RepID=UPI001182B0AF|nr:RNA 3'-terminal phosphate cyclase [Shewanella algae]QTE94147.1 hypothetical protein JKK45_17140 [Shewanella algae]TVO79822.1 hypothetical protein AYI78_21280 [Shewanella algae]TVO79914.1 hypothetical protein AYI76_21385 [Shewanella algae]TVO89974.1 hypothetical protein AYI79_21290 [Shewanella algae]
MEEQLADQLLIPMALAGKGSYTTSKPSLHTSTNIEVIKQFMDINIRAEQQNELCWQISISS